MKKMMLAMLFAVSLLPAMAQQAAPKAPELDYVMQLKVKIDAAYTVGDTPHGRRVVIPIAPIAVHLAVGVMSIETPLQLITMLTPCFTCYYLWFFRDTQRIRVGNIVGNTLWLVYNCLGGLWILALTRVWTIALNAAAYLRYRRQAAPLPRPRAQTH